MVAGDGTARVDLAHLPIRVRPGLILAIQVEFGTALGPEAAALAGASPGLVNFELVGRAVESESSCVARHRLGAVVDKVAVEEVGQLVGHALALGLVRHVWVFQGEVDVAPGVLVSGRSEGI